MHGRPVRLVEVVIIFFVFHSKAKRAIFDNLGPKITTNPFRLVQYVVENIIYFVGNIYNIRGDTIGWSFDLWR